MSIMVSLRTVFSAVLLVNISVVSARPDISSSMLQNKRAMDAEMQAYRHWYDAFKERNLPSAIKLGEAYLQEYPKARYGEYVTKINEFARISLNEDKIAQAQAFRSVIQASLAKDATRLEFLLKEALNERTDLNATTGDGRTALMFAAAERRAEAMKALLEKGASADVVESTQGLTALIYAIWTGDRNLVSNLLRYYPDATIKDKEGRTALDHAMLSADFEMMLLIIGRLMQGVTE